MPKFLDWGHDTNEDRPKNGGGASGMFLRLEAGGKYSLRLVSKPIRYLQHWEPIICRSPGYAEDGTIRDPLIQMGYEPKARYAIWVLNRADQNRLQIVDFPASLFDKFKDWKEAFNEEPGGSNGPDWRVSLEIPAKGGKRRTEYKATAGPQVPFTDEELARIRAGVTVGDKTMDLRQALEYHRRDDTPEDIRQKLAEKQAQGPLAPPGSNSFGARTPATAAVAAPAAASPVPQRRAPAPSTDPFSSGDQVPF